ncbi:helix-turn-helix transcriptional regulator [Amycolatopsis sp. TNS106]|uniref:helix-turn-helix transcriptional regulator n=1 Tax=Amycolatopsis sp. TNS106 TaxID=2861750 RepID=UPI001C5951B3|nr:helix-turn-helix transcriptional regulator [Amycolatopsis sp. TNS106]
MTSDDAGQGLTERALVKIRRLGLVADRKAAGHTQESLAAALDVDVKTVRQWENGTYKPSTPFLQQRLAGELRITRRQLALRLDPPTDSTDGSFADREVGAEPTDGDVRSAPVRPDSSPELSSAGQNVINWRGDSSRPGNPAPSVVHSDIPQLRRVLDTRDLPEDGPVRPLSELTVAVQTVVARRLQSDYAVLAADVNELLPELHRAILSAPPSLKPHYAGLLARTYRAADAVADKFGYYDLSARIIDLMRTAATQSGDELLVGSAAYVRGEIYFATHDLDAGSRMLTAAANKIHVSASETAAATYGTLHMRAAVMAARAGSALRARDHIEEAKQAARQVNEGVHLGTVFGVPSVRIHQLSLAVELGDVGGALRLASSWAPPITMPAERRSHFYIDLGRAFHLADQPERVLSAFREAGRIAPEHVREHSQVIDVVDHLELTTRGQLRDAFADFAASLVKPQSRSGFGQ